MFRIIIVITLLIFFKVNTHAQIIEHKKKSYEFQDSLFNQLPPLSNLHDQIILKEEVVKTIELINLYNTSSKEDVFNQLIKNENDFKWMLSKITRTEDKDFLPFLQKLMLENEYDEATRFDVLAVRFKLQDQTITKEEYLFYSQYFKYKKGKFSQSDFHENVCLTMVAEEREEGTILVCSIENKSSKGFWTEFFTSQGNDVIITDSEGYNLRYEFFHCGRDSSHNYIYPLSTKTWEYNLTPFFTSNFQLPNGSGREIPKGEYRIFWQVFYKPTREYLRSQEIIFHHEPLTKE